MAEEIIKARVWQKIDTESNWNANPLVLGPGEAAFVVTPSGAPVNFKLGDGTKTFAQLPWYFDWGAQAGVPKAADTATVFPPGDPGFYLPTEDGTYDGVTVDLSEGVNYLIWDGSDLSKIVYPINLAGYATTVELGKLNPVTALIEGKDVGNINVSVGYYLDTNGQLVAFTSNWHTTDFWPVTPGDLIIYQGSTAGGLAQAVAGYDENGNFVSILLGTNISPATANNVIIPDGVHQVRASGATNTQPLSLIVNSVVVPSMTIGRNTGRSWGAIGHSIWWQDGRVYQGTSTVAVGIQTIVQRQVQFSDYHNYGYSGRSLAGTSDTDVQSILEAKGDWVALDIYTYDSITNDFKLNRPIGTTDDFVDNTGITTYYGALRILHDTLNSLNTDYSMIAANALQRNNAGYTSFSTNSAGHTLADYSEALEWVCNRLSWRFVDQFRDSGIRINNLPSFTLDGLHPNNAGYARYSGLWIDEFMKI